LDTFEKERMKLVSVTVVEKVSGSEDPKVQEFKNYIKNCPEEND